MDSHSGLTVNPTNATVEPGQQVRYQFVTIGDETVTYQVQCADATVGSWCQVLLAAARASAGELVVDVPTDARPGGYVLRLVAMAAGQEISDTDIVLCVEGERCLRAVSLPKLSVEADGTVLLTLRVVNCGMVDVNLLLRARHEDGWSFEVDSPELIIGVAKGPVTVKVTLRSPSGRKVKRGDRITVEVETGTGWQPLPGRVPRPVWPWVAAAAAVAAATAGAVSAGWPQANANDNIRTSDGQQTTATPTGGPQTTETTAGDGPRATETTTDSGAQTTGTTLGSTAQPLRVVPDVVGETEASAAAILQDAGFGVAAEQVDATEVEPGIVAEQDPPALTEAPTGATVTIAVSVGPSLVTVPDVVGRSEQDASNILQEQGFEITNVNEKESAEAPGIVIRSDPAGGTRVPADSASVALVVSSGPPPPPPTDPEID